MPYRDPFSKLALGALCFLLPSSATRADDPQEPAAPTSWLESAEQQASEWNVTIGGGFRIEPKFEGADDFRIMPVPLVSADFGPYVSVNASGVTINALDYEGMSVKGRLGYDIGRDSSDDGHLDGLGDVDAGAVLGLDLAYNLDPVEFKLSLDKIVGGSDGLSATFGAAYSLPIDQFKFSIGPSVTWADSNYMESYFGVTDRQSRRSGLSEFDADAGIKRVDLEISGMYMLDEHWLVRGEVSFGALVGDAADSPVSQTNFQPSTMFLVGYRF
jgi:outer membrane scaffolding protein for murein synthesis (MipA/OmpV family)